MEFDCRPAYHSKGLPATGFRPVVPAKGASAIGCLPIQNGLVVLYGCHPEPCLPARGGSRDLSLVPQAGHRDCAQIFRLRRCAPSLNMTRACTESQMRPPGKRPAPGISSRPRGKAHVGNGSKAEGHASGPLLSKRGAPYSTLPSSRGKQIQAPVILRQPSHSEREKPKRSWRIRRVLRAPVGGIRS